MAAFVVGIVEEPGPRGADVPEAPPRTVTVIQGAVNTIHVKVYRSQGGAFDIEGYGLAMFVKKSQADGGALVRLLGTPDATLGDGWFTVTASANDTGQLVPGLYVYDAWVYVLTNPTAPTRVTPLSRFVVEASCAYGSNFPPAVPVPEDVN